MNRRTFLKSAAALPAAFALQSAARGRVIVVGAGLAGLSAGHELDRAGYDVVLLEARTRPGGRVHTLREPFSDGLYAEAGAARIQDSHAFTLRYVTQFNLALDPFFPADGASITLVAGRRFVLQPGETLDLAQLPSAFSAEERALGLRGSLGKYLFSSLAEVGDPTASDWPARDLSRFEVSIPDFCRRQGASAALVQMLAFGHDLGGMSALHLLRDTAVGAATKQWFKIRGGNDLLPKALAATLADKILYGAPVVRLEQDDAGVRVTYLHAESPLTVAADLVVCAIPLPVLRRIAIAPALPSAIQAAIDEVDYLPMARVFLQSRRRFWRERGESGWATSDDPIDVWDYTRDQPGRRGILGAYTSGRMARQVSARDPAARVPFVLEMMERVHPGIREHFEGGASYSWITDPWALGAAAEFKAGQMSRHYAGLRTAVGRLHFAGEHTSPWGGWMNGGLESGHRAAAEIMARRS